MARLSFDMMREANVISKCQISAEDKREDRFIKKIAPVCHAAASLDRNLDLELHLQVELKVDLQLDVELLLESELEAKRWRWTSS